VQLGQGRVGVSAPPRPESFLYALVSFGFLPGLSVPRNCLARRTSSGFHRQSVRPLIGMAIDGRTRARASHRCNVILLTPINSAAFLVEYERIARQHVSRFRVRAKGIVLKGKPRLQPGRELSDSDQQKHSTPEDLGNARDPLRNGRAPRSVARFG
jgi:hypothetical protein